MAIAVNIPQQPIISQAQALWTVFKNQPESVRADFMLLLKADEEERLRSVEDASQSRRFKYSDADLDELLKDCPMFCEEEIPEFSDEDYRAVAKGAGRKPIKGIEKWL